MVHLKITPRRDQSGRLEVDKELLKRGTRVEWRKLGERGLARENGATAAEPHRYIF